MNLKKAIIPVLILLLAFGSVTTSFSQGLSANNNQSSGLTLDESMNWWRHPAKGVVDINNNKLWGLPLTPVCDTCAAAKSYVDSNSSGSPGQPFSFVSQHTSYSNGLDTEPIYRTVMQSGDTLIIDRVEARLKGGGSDTAYIDIYSNSQGGTIAQQSFGGTTFDPGSSDAGDTIQVRISNNTGSAVVGSITIQGRIK